MKEKYCTGQRAHICILFWPEVLVFSLGCGVGMGGKSEEWDPPGGRRGHVRGDDFREVMTLELGS